jgi:hypothetical protein
VLDSSRSLNSIGSPVYIFQPRGDLDKRQATVQLCIRAEGPQLCRAVLIFRGRGKSVSEEEQAVYKALAPWITVYWQPKVTMLLCRTNTHIVSMCTALGVGESGS